MRFNYMICPVQDLATNAFSDIHCVPNQTFVWREFALNNTMIKLIGTFVSGPSFFN